LRLFGLGFGGENFSNVFGDFEDSVRSSAVDLPENTRFSGEKGGSSFMRTGYFTVALILGSIAASPLPAQETASQDPTKMPQAELAKVQQALKHEGYDPGNVDGTWGPGSTQAVADFQANRAIPTSHGLIDSTTLHALHVAAPQ
jgi:hypothetical protein